MKKRKVALVYDWVDKWGGVERLLLVLHKMYPNAPLYTSFYNRRTAHWAKDFKIKTSFMQNLPEFVKSDRVLSLPFFPFAFRSFNFEKYDTVITITSSFAKFIKIKPSSKHICILLTPTRFLWSHQSDYFPSSIKDLMTPLMNRLKKWDFEAAQRPDKLFAISKHVQGRVQKYYTRDSELLYPPFDSGYWKKIKKLISSEKFKPSFYFIPKKEYYLVVSRLESYKKIDLVIKTFNKLKRPLIIVGTGSQEETLQHMANDNILFLKNVSDAEVAYLYTYARALIMAQNEDFGYTSLEAQFFGCPVISYKNSGVAETIVNKKAGILFDYQSLKSLTSAIETSKKIPYNVRHESDYLRGWSWHKTLATFKKKISQAVRENSRRAINASTHGTKTYSGV